MCSSSSSDTTGDVSHVHVDTYTSTCTCMYLTVRQQTEESTVSKGFPIHANNVQYKAYNREMTMLMRLTVCLDKSNGSVSVKVSLYCSVKLVVQPVNDSVLEQLNKFSTPSSHLHTHTPSHPHILDDVGMGMGMEEREMPHEPSPFSTKKDMYSGKVGAQVRVYLYIDARTTWQLPCLIQSM